MSHGLVKFIDKEFLMVRMYSVMVEMFCISDAFSSKGTVGDFVCFYCLSGKYFVCFASLQKHGKSPNFVFLFNFNATLMHCHANTWNVATPSKGWLGKQLYGIRGFVVGVSWYPGQAYLMVYVRILANAMHSFYGVKLEILETFDGVGLGF